jgi:predicted AlkP superfamily pyrophosphatase or phosphodiesterase
MKSLKLIALGLLYVGSCYPQTVSRPKLVVGMVIDQMRWDYLYRFSDMYGRDGFKRLLAEGYNCQNTMINYIPSYTAPGHACIYTGSVPSIHGIVGNDFVDNYSCNSQYCVVDNSVNLVVNGDTAANSMSPRNLLTTTITDELRLATNFRSRVYGVSNKDRGSIIPAGHLANGAFWFDENTGSFVSSTYYKNANPAWLATLNKRKLADSFMSRKWELLYPAEKYSQSIKDINNYEGAFAGEKSVGFPHDLTNLTGKVRYHSFLSTPGGNSSVFQLASACLEGEQLGQSSTTDFLCVSLSATDYIGHQFAPNSIEIEDAYLRLDQDIATFLRMLDKKYGKDNYLFFLTADHGAAHNPQYLKDEHVPAGFLPDNTRADLNRHLKEVFGSDSIVQYYINYQVYLNEPLITRSGIDREKVKASVMSYFQGNHDIVYIIDMENIDKTPLPEPIRSMVVNGYHRSRSGDIEVIPNPGWFQGYGVTGTTHGTWHPYDTHIPLLWYGWHIPAGETYSVVNMTDISATLAALLHIQMPNGCIGKPITELLQK